MHINLQSLITRLNPATRAATEAAAGLCLSRTHYNVEVEHYLAKLLDTIDTDFAILAHHFSVDTGRFAADINRALERFKRGNGRTPTLSPDLVDMMTNAWTIATIDFGATQVR